MTVSITETDDLDTCRALRLTVFVEEQKVPIEEEIDDLDDVSTHLIACDSDGRAIGTARIYEVGDTGKIGRVCVLREMRGKSIGARLIEHCISVLSARPHIVKARLGAQNHAIPFYEKLGFVVVGEEYMDAGIPHHDMERTL